MTDPNELPELVRHLQQQATFQQGRTVHKLIRTRRGAQKHETWIRQKKIGHGGFGEVWLERKEPSTQDRMAARTPELRAVKCIHASLQRRDYVRELEALATFSSNKDKYLKSFVQFHGWFQSEEWLHAIMEYCEYGDLRHYLQEHGKIREAEVQDITRQILAGVSLMHRAGFAHRDIKPANVLIKKAPPDNWWVKLGDLGLSKRAEATAGSTTVRATPGFVPPEILGLFAGQDPKQADPFSADMWCLAETVFQALANRGTFDTYGALMQYVVGGLEFPNEALADVGVSDQGIKFIQHLMAPSPLHRPSSEQAIGHPWIVIEDDNKSDDGNTQYIEEAAAIPDQDTQGDITQPDIHWTTDLDTTNAEGLSWTQPGPKIQGPSNVTQRSDTSHQEAITMIQPAMNSERRDVLITDYHEDENRIEGPQSVSSGLILSPQPTNDSVQFSLHGESIMMEETPEQLLTMEGRYRGRKVDSPFEKSEDSQSAGEDEIKAYVHTRGGTRIQTHSIAAEYLSRRVLSELGCRYELSEEENLVIFHAGVSKDDIRDLVALSRHRRATSPRSRSRSVDRLPRLSRKALLQSQPHKKKVHFKKSESDTSNVANLGNRKYLSRIPLSRAFTTEPEGSYQHQHQYRSHKI